MRNKPILCVDFDGVIHSYTSPWVDAVTIPDPPVPGALRWLWKATEWFDVQVYSSRSKSPEARRAMGLWMARFSLKEFGEGHPMAYTDDCGAVGPVYPIGFAHEKPAAFLTIDDRAFCFEGDWSEIEPVDMLNFKPWNKRRVQLQQETNMTTDSALGIHPPPTEFTYEEQKTDDVLRFFHYAHLPPALQARSKPFCDLARTIIDTLPRCQQRTIALNKLLEAKDCAVRASLPPPVSPA